MALHPSTLTVIWGCYQGGVETAIYYRTKQLNRSDGMSHVYFYYPGMGVESYSEIPHRISSQRSDFLAYLNKHRFDYVTFVNTLYNLDLVAQSVAPAKVLYEIHGYGSLMAEELERIDRGEDGGLVRGVVAPSPSVAAWARSFLKNRTDVDVFVATNTLDLDRFRSTPELEPFLQHTRLRNAWLNSPLLGWVGRLDGNKNWSVFRKLRARRMNFKLLIVSDLTKSRHLHRFYAKAAKYGLVSCVRILPNIPHDLMPLYYSLISRSGGVLISTSLSEGYPYNVLEAQACECPVVCSQIPGSLELVRHEETGLTFPLDRPKEAVRAVERLMDDAMLRTRIQHNARTQALERNGMEANVSAYLEWLGKISEQSAQSLESGTRGG